MEDLKQYINIRKVPQRRPIPGSTQVPNSAGGFVWAISPWERLERFLVLGSEGGTYYASGQTLTAQNASAAVVCIQEDGERVVKQVVAISDKGAAASNDPALFVLALAAAVGDLPTRQAAMAALPKVARTGTHLFHFLEFVNGLRGWGRGLRRAVGDWYTQMEPSRLAYQVVKYQQRNGWSHRDALRLAHPDPVNPVQDAIFHWVVKQGWEEIGEELPEEKALTLLWVYEKAKRAQSEAEIVTLIREHGLTWEFVPSSFLKSAAVWKALLPNLPLTALLRNLARMTANGALTPDSPEAEYVVSQLTDGAYVKRSRLHPLTVLMGLKTYAMGRGMRGSLRWKPVRQVVEALDKAFYLAFDNVVPTGKRTMLALDVSGSMTVALSGMPGLSAREASAALALVTARIESKVMVTVFSSGGKNFYSPSGDRDSGRWGRTGNGLSEYPLTGEERLEELTRRISGLAFGGTDCALPMLYATERNLPVDAFVVYTDSETWHGSVHPAQALKQYRQKMGIPAKLVVVGMVSNGFSIADRNDPGMLDVVGMSTATPKLIGQFIRE